MKRFRKQKIPNYFSILIIEKSAENSPLISWNFAKLCFEIVDVDDFHDCNIVCPLCVFLDLKNRKKNFVIVSGKTKSNHQQNHRQ